MKILKNNRRSPHTATFKPPAFDHPAVIALRPMLERILATYGLTPGSSRLAIHQALRDHVARIMIHPYAPLHPAGSTANLTSLPPDCPTWAQFNTAMLAVVSPGVNRLTEENIWWGQFGLDGIARINVQYGTLNVADGTLADNGMYTEYAPGKWRWRTLAGAKSTQCSYQHNVLATFDAAFGIPGTIVSTVGHDGHIAYIVDDTDGGDLGWVYDEATYNECFFEPGETRPLSPLELHRHSLAGTHGTLISTKRAGPSHDPAPYIPNTPGLDDTYFMGNPAHPLGMYLIGSHLNHNHIGVAQAAQNIGATTLATAGLGDGSPNATTFSSPFYAKVGALAAFPELGVMLSRVQREAGVTTFKVGSTWPGPGPQVIERRVNGGAWSLLKFDGDSLPDGLGTVEYRVTDATGFRGSRAKIVV